MIYFYTGSVIFSLAIYVFHNWFIGRDLDTDDFVSMLIGAILPVINLVCCIACLIDLFNEMVDIDFPKTILKGRKK